MGSTATVRGSEIAEVLGALGDILAAAPPRVWELPSLCEGWRVKDALAHLVWRVGTPSLEFAGDIVRESVRKRHLNPMNSMDGIALELAAAHSTSELLAMLRTTEADKRAGRGRTNAGELTESVVHGYDIAHPFAHLPVAPDVTHRVAQAGLVMAPRRVRLTVRHRTLVASDAGWSIGDGPELEATAETIVLFIFGRRAIDDGYTRVLAPGPAPAPKLA